MVIGTDSSAAQRSLTSYEAPPGVRHENSTSDASLSPANLDGGGRPDILSSSQVDILHTNKKHVMVMALKMLMPMLLPQMHRDEGRKGSVDGHPLELVQPYLSHSTWLVQIPC